jgi:hypothetical protein
LIGAVAGAAVPVKSKNGGSGVYTLGVDLPAAGVNPAPPPAGTPPAPFVSPLTLVVVRGRLLVLSTQTGQVLLSVQLDFGNLRLLHAVVVADAEGLPDVIFILQDRHSRKLKVVRADGVVLLRLLRQLAGLPGGGMVAVLEGDGLQFIVGTESGVPAIDVYSGGTGSLLRQFSPFPGGRPQGRTGVARVSLREDNGVPELVVSAPGQGIILLDARTLLSPSVVVFGAALT